MKNILQLLRIASLVLADDKFISPEQAQTEWAEYQKLHPKEDRISVFTMEDWLKSIGKTIQDIEPSSEQVDDVASDTADKVQKELLDKQYIDAVNEAKQSGKLDIVQKMVDEAAKMAGIQIKTRKVESLKPLIQFNSKSQVFTNDTRPILVDSDNNVLDGNHRLELAKRRGDDIINVVVSLADKSTGRLTVKDDYQKIYKGHLSEPIVYNDDGKIIPLSQRFN